MKFVLRWMIAGLCVPSLMSSSADAQDLQQQVVKLGREAAIEYVTPILSGWGNDLNSGIYYSGDLHDALGFDIGVRFAASRIKEADKTFTIGLPSQLIYSYKKNDKVYGLIYNANQFQGNVAGNPGKLSTSTAVGDKTGGVVTSTVDRTAVASDGSTDIVPAGTPIFQMPGGFDVGSLGVSLPMPQFDLGLPFGLELMLRYVPTVSTGDAGKFNASGFGLRYSIDQLIPLCPVDISVHFMTQKLNFKSKDENDIFSATGTAYGLEVSKKIFILTLYTGFQLESSVLTLADYQYAGNDPLLQGTIINGFDVHGDNKSRFTFGGRLLLMAVNIHAEYSIANTPVIAIGAGITIR